jgi:hypothetical protein
MRTTDQGSNRVPSNLPILSSPTYRTPGLATIPDSGNPFRDQHRIFSLPSSSERSQVARQKLPSPTDETESGKIEGDLGSGHMMHSLENVRREQKRLVEETSSYSYSVYKGSEKLGDKEYPNIWRNVDRRLMETGSPIHVAAENSAALPGGDSSTHTKLLRESRAFSRIEERQDETRRFSAGAYAIMQSFECLFC